MIDTHMHLLPGMDNGAEDMEMALVMMFRAPAAGYFAHHCHPSCLQRGRQGYF